MQYKSKRLAIITKYITYGIFVQVKTINCTENRTTSRYAYSLDVSLSIILLLSSEDSCAKVQHKIFITIMVAITILLDH